MRKRRKYKFFTEKSISYGRRLFSRREKNDECFAEKKEKGVIKMAGRCR